MREKRWSTAIGVALGVLLLIPQAALAADADQTRMESLEERLMALEDKLEASEATVAAQREMLQREVPDVSQGSGLDAFFSGLEFGGHVTGSYIYNFNNPDFNDFTQTHNQFNQDHNTFKVDAVKFELGKAASEPGQAGFQVDLLWGENAAVLNNLASGVFYGSSSTTLFSDPSDEEVFVQEAWVSYNYDGVLLQMGKFETLLGYEVLDSPYNPHVTHGAVYTFAIPLFHTGLLASGSMGEGLEWAAGVVNGFNNATDFNDNKGFLGRLGMSQDNMSLTFNTFIGSEGLRASSRTGLGCGGMLPGSGSGAAGANCFGDNNNRTQIYNLVGTLEPQEGLSLWMDAVYGFQEIDSGLIAIPIGATGPGGGVEDPEWIAIALGMTFDLTEKTSVALRGEYFHDDGNFRIGHGAFGEEADHITATVTLAHQLTDNLMARLEYRHDRVDGNGPGSDDDVFFRGDRGTTAEEDQQDIGILEVSYTFN